MNPRTTWAELPAEARLAVEAHTGPVIRAESADLGVMSVFASALHSASQTVFVKATPAGAPNAWTYRHEARVTRVAPLAAPVLWEEEAGGWSLYGYGFLTGRGVSFAPGSADLPALVEALVRLSGVGWPQEIGKKTVVDRLAAFLPDGSAGLLSGRCLAHTDMGQYNLLMTRDGLRVLDWALSCPAPAWTDAALTVPRLIAAGHTPERAEAVVRQVPAYRDAEPRAVLTFARAIQGFWTHRTRTAPTPSREKLTAAATEWASARA